MNHSPFRRPGTLPKDFGCADPLPNQFDNKKMRLICSQETSLDEDCQCLAGIGSQKPKELGAPLTSKNLKVPSPAPLICISKLAIAKPTAQPKSDTSHSQLKSQLLANKEPGLRLFAVEANCARSFPQIARARVSRCQTTPATEMWDPGTFISAEAVSKLVDDDHADDKAPKKPVLEEEDNQVLHAAEVEKMEGGGDPTRRIAKTMMMTRRTRTVTVDDDDDDDNDDNATITMSRKKRGRGGGG